MDWQLIESDAELVELLARGADADVVVMDTEFMRRNTFFPQVALVQLCFVSGAASGTAWLIDPLEIKDPEPLATLLTNPSVIKVFHSASEDLEVFQQWLGALPDPLFDSQRAAALVDLGFGLGYRALVDSICDIDLPKGETRSDWLQRPLTQSQCEYAAQDVIWLVKVYEHLISLCHDNERFDWVLQDGRDAASSLASNSNEYYKRIKNAWKLDSRQLARLIAVCDWRERTARLKDKPRSWIIDDKACLRLAQENPQDYADLKARVEMPPPALRRYGSSLLELLEGQGEPPESELPQRLPGPLDAAQRKQIKSLKQAVRTIAGELAMAPEVLLQARDYEALLRESEGHVVSEPLHWQGWRRERVIVPLRNLLAAGEL